MMVAMFWDSEGLILTHCFPKSTTVTGETYEDMNEVFPALREKRLKDASAVLFHLDDVPPNRAARVQQFFEDNNFEVVPRAPYPPDLAPSDFWLFPKLMETLRGSWKKVLNI
jgi:histone-lysine N-methyltransferase SETMAR